MTARRAKAGAAKSASAPKRGEFEEREGVVIHYDDASNLYASWPRPICIIADGPYGVSGFPGDPPTPDSLSEWYEPHVREWSVRATPQTTLWFWNTEIGWANVHPILKKHGWEYRNCHIWDKGLSHVAGNANSKTLRKFPVVTEVCVQYVKAAEFKVNGEPASMQDWLRYEWKRSGLPFRLSNEATGTQNAGTRKYLTGDHLWYYPPVEAFEGLASYANKHGDELGKPYFSLDGKKPISGKKWAKLRAKFYCDFGINNVWHAGQVRGTERLKKKWRCIHNNQKPLALIDICIRACTDKRDVVWEPFGGLCTAAIASHGLGRRCVAAETLPEYYLAAKERLASYDGAEHPTTANAESA